MSSVLLVTKEFPPYYSQVGAMIRIVELANFLTNAGHTVSVIGLERDTEYSNLLKLDDRVNSYYVRDPVLSYSGTKSRSFLMRLYRKLRRIYVRNLAIDSVHPSLSKYRAKIKFVVRKHGVKTILISSPPCSLRLLSVWLKSYYGRDVRVIADYRDPWTVRKKYVENLSQSQLKQRKRLEQRTLDANDLTVFVSSGMLSQYREYFSVSNALVVENGYVARNRVVLDPQLLTQVETLRAAGRLIIGFIGKGSVSGQGAKDFRILLEILKANPSVGRRTALVIAGEVAGIEQHRNTTAIVDAGIVSNELAQSLMSTIDLGLSVYSETLDAPAVMGGKLYDYIGVSKPIWFLVPQNAHSIYEFVRKHGKGYISDVFSEESIYAGLMKILKDKDEGRLHQEALSAQQAREYRRDVQYARLMPYIDS